MRTERFNTGMPAGMFSASSSGVIGWENSGKASRRTSTSRRSMVTSASFNNWPRVSARMGHGNFAPNRGLHGHVANRRRVPCRSTIHSGRRIGIDAGGRQVEDLQGQRFVGHRHGRPGTGQMEFQFAPVLDIFPLQRGSQELGQVGIDRIGGCGGRRGLARRRTSWSVINSGACFRTSSAI